MSRPRVALVAHGVHDAGGMERAFAELIRRLHDRYEIIVFSIDLAPDLRRLVEWRRIPAPRRPAALRFLVFYVVAAVRLAAADPDLVHTLGAVVPNSAGLSSVHHSNAGFVDVVGALAPRDAPLLRRLNTGLARALALLAERWSYRTGRVARLGPVSDGVASELRRHHPCVPLTVVPNGVDRARFRPDAAARAAVRSLLGIPADDVVALFVGGDWHGKGLAIAIEAVAMASERAWLVVVGEGDVPRFAALAARHGAGERVVFAGPRPDTERFYAAADVFILPSAYETFSLASFEAAASGLPIVVPPLNGVAELIGDRDAGIVVERDPLEFALALAQLAASPDVRRRLGAAARERSAPFTWDRSAEAVECVYRSLLTGSAA